MSETIIRNQGTDVVRRVKHTHSAGQDEMFCLRNHRFQSERSGHGLVSKNRRSHLVQFRYAFGCPGSPREKDDPSAVTCKNITL